MVADRDRRFLRRLFYRDPDAERGVGPDPAADAPVPDRGRRAAAGGGGPSGLRPGPDLDRRRRARRPRRALPRRGDVVLRRTFRAATGVSFLHLSPEGRGENGYTLSNFCRQRTTSGRGASGKLVGQSVTPTSPT